MDIMNVNGRTLREICRTLKQCRAEDGFSYRTFNAGQDDPSNPSTWSLPVYHGSKWATMLNLKRYLQAFPKYQSILAQFGIDPQSLLVEDHVFEQ
jgi:hypothetical protein